MSKAMDGGSGLSSGTPKSRTMKFYKEVNGVSGGFDERGNPRKTGCESDVLSMGGTGDATKHQGKFSGQSKANAKSPEAKVSKKLKRPHSIGKGAKTGKID